MRYLGVVLHKLLLWVVGSGKALVFYFSAKLRYEEDFFEINKSWNCFSDCFFNFMTSETVTHLKM
jgi:hypothetical protein